MSDHFRKLAAMYRSAPVNEIYGPNIDVSEGRAVVEMRVDRRFFHPADALHGSVLFKALDDAAFFAANSLVPDFFVLTVSFNVSFLRPAVEGLLRAEGRVTRATKNLTFAEAVLFLPDGDEAARGTGIFVPSRIRLDGVPSYAQG